jgi:mannose-1-phosphate guanylyltransferase
MNAPHARIQPVILSGGSGTRLWPLSREERPKQFLPLTGRLTMLQLTLERVHNQTGYASPLIIANARHADEIAGQLAEIGAEGANLILEPAGRNTAAAIALAALRSDPADALLVMPSDHVIRDAEGFRAAVQAALPATQENYLLTFGISPDAPETGYGYIRRGEALAPSLYRVDQFVEKPGVETARHYLASGDYSWNAGIFLFTARDYLEALGLHAPDILAACEEAVREGRSEGALFHPQEAAFCRSPSISVDYAVMEKAERVAVAPIDVGWSDIGSWDALYDYLQSNGGGEDEASVLIDSPGCLVKSDGPIVAAVGVRDLIIVATQGAVLVMPRGESQRVKEVIERLKGR